MKRSLAIVLAAAVVGGIAGAVIGIALDRGHKSRAGLTAALDAPQVVSAKPRRRREERAWLGVQVKTIDPSVARVARGMPKTGVIVARVVQGSPAASVRVGDAIVGVDGKHVTSASQVADAVALRKPGDRLTLEVVHKGARRTVDVTLGNVPARS